MIDNKLYKRETYLSKIRGFYNDTEMVKVITGIRRCGKSSLLKSIIEELRFNGVKEENIIYIQLDSKKYKKISTPEQLEKIIDAEIKNDEFKYLFIDEIQNVKDFEKVIEAYRLEENISIFITGSNSYLLSGELITKLSGRKIEFEIHTLNFYEYEEMKKFLNIKINDNLQYEFEEYVRYGGFPGALMYERYEDKISYISNIISDIFEKDIRANKKIKNTETFKAIQNFIINNFGTQFSSKSIKDYFINLGQNIDVRTINKYIELLENAKILYKCQGFDIKSKSSLKNERKYYLADTSIFFVQNTDNRVYYGPILENIIYNYLLSKDYKLSVGKIGKFECDFIARKGLEDYFYIQVTKNMDDDTTFEREVRSLKAIKELYPRYILTLDVAFQRNISGIRIENIIEFLSKNKELLTREIE